MARLPEGGSPVRQPANRSPVRTIARARRSGAIGAAEECMSENLGNFLVDLATDPDLAGRFSDNPQAELERRGLTPDEQAAIMTRDSRRVGSALGASPAKSGEGVQNKKNGA